MVLSLLILLSRAVGLCNLRFVPESGRFKRDNGPMLIYWITLHFIYLLVIPYVFVVRVSSSFHCQKIDILAVAYTIISVVKVFSLLLLIISIWVCRGRWLRMGNSFLALQQLYRSDLRTISLGQRLQHMWKLLMCLSKIILTMYSMYGPNSMLMCNIFEEKESPVSLIYIGSTIVALPLEIIVCCIDYWIYHLTRVSNWLIDCLSLEVQELKKDIGWLPRRRGCYRNVYQQQLFVGWRHLWRHCVRLDKVHREMIMIFQWQMLLNILTNYLTDITSLFNLIIYLSEPQTAHHIVYLIGYWITCIIFHLNIISFFAIFGTNRLKWKHLLEQVHELFLTLCSMDIVWHEDIYCVALYRQVEFSIIFRNRCLQRRPDRMRRLHIAGLFDLNRRSEFCMSTSVAMNVVILWQIAYKYYF